MRTGLTVALTIRLTIGLKDARDLRAFVLSWHCSFAAIDPPEAKQMDNRITIDPAICHGKPCIRGLRYPVESVLEWLAAGMSIDNILADYTDLEREDILAVLAFAARMAHVNRIEPIAA